MLEVKKRAISVVVVLCMMISMMSGFSIVVNAAVSGTCGSLTWNLDDEGTLTISGTGAMPDYASSGEVPWYARRNSVKKINISDTVNYIGDFAFYDCNNITEIVIPDGVTNIGYRAFRSCDALASLTLPESITTIKDDAFQSCASLTNVTYGGSQLTWKNVSVGANNTLLTNAAFTYEKGVCGENLSWWIESDGTLVISGTGAMTDFASSGDVPWYLRRNAIKKVNMSDTELIEFTKNKINSKIYC